MKRFFIFLNVLFILMSTAQISFAENNSVNASEEPSAPTLYINDKMVEQENGILVDEYGNYLFPMRTVLEKIGATVTWDATTGYTHFRYKMKMYTCMPKEELYSNISGTIRTYLICRGKRTEPISIGVLGKDYINLNPMSGSGVGVVINGRTYLPEQTMTYLLKELKCGLVVDVENNIVHIEQ